MNALADQAQRTLIDSADKRCTLRILPQCQVTTSTDLKSARPARTHANFRSLRGKYGFLNINRPQKAGGGHYAITSRLLREALRRLSAFAF